MWWCALDANMQPIELVGDELLARYLPWCAHLKGQLYGAGRGELMDVAAEDEE
ncbi:MAG: hypothetical protein ACLVIR_12895 [Clostridium sp.]